MLSKNLVRKTILQRLKRLRDLTRFERQNDLINRRVQNELKGRDGIWAAFMPLVNEPNLNDTYKKLEGQIQFAFPKVIDGEIQFFAKSKDFLKGKHGILEPDHKNAQHILPTELSGVLIPGVAFDYEGSRLGRGKAFYDKFLKNCHAEKIGVCFQVQVLNQTLKTQKHDEKIDRLITENLSLGFVKSLVQSFDLSSFPERNFI